MKALKNHKEELESLKKRSNIYYKERNEYRARTEAAALLIDAGLYHDAYRALGKH